MNFIQQQRHDGVVLLKPPRCKHFLFHPWLLSLSWEWTWEVEISMVTTEEWCCLVWAVFFCTNSTFLIIKIPGGCFNRSTWFKYIWFASSLKIIFHNLAKWELSKLESCYKKSGLQKKEMDILTWVFVSFKPVWICVGSAEINPPVI